LRTLALALAGLMVAIPAVGQGGAAPCTAVEAFGALDFWVGEWDVQVEGRTVGSNTIARVLEGCAVTETWRAAGGGEGRSLFYYLPGTGEWKQVWVTGRATAPGGVKEKTLLPGYDGGGVRFQGEITTPDGRSYLDRTTLIPLGDGRVRQHIEISTDGGASWRTTFDAVYVPVTAG
jgi:hypothetical protein